MKAKAPAKKATKKGAASGEAPAATHRPFAALKKAPPKPAPEAAKKAAPAAPAKAPPAKAPPGKRAPAHGSLESTGPTDPEAFAALVRGVVPLGAPTRRLPRSQASLERSTKATTPPEDLDLPARAALAALVTDGLRFEVIDDGTTLEGRRLDVDPRELRRLRTGRYPIDGDLDLHGHALASAREAVARFVDRRRMQGDRAVRVVHGKGSHSAGGTPVLRGELGAWLSSGRAAQCVLAFVSLDDASVAVLLAKR